LLHSGINHEAKLSGDPSKLVGGPAISHQAKMSGDMMVAGCGSDINYQAKLSGDMSKLVGGSDINHRASVRGGRPVNVTEGRFSAWREHYAKLLDPTPSAADRHIWSSYTDPTTGRLYSVNNLTGIPQWEQPDFAKIERLSKAQVWEAPHALTKFRLKTITVLGQRIYSYDYGFVKFEKSTHDGVTKPNACAAVAGVAQHQSRRGDHATFKAGS